MQDMKGQAECRQCVFKEYQDERGATSCKHCPDHTDNFQQGSLLRKSVADLKDFVPDR